LYYVSYEDMVMECVDGKTALFFPVLAAWIADHAEHTTLHGIGSRSDPKCHVLCNERGGNPWEVFEVYDNAIYEEKAR